MKIMSRPPSQDLEHLRAENEYLRIELAAAEDTAWLQERADCRHEYAQAWIKEREELAMQIDAYIDLRLNTEFDELKADIALAFGLREANEQLRNDLVESVNTIQELKRELRVENLRERLTATAREHGIEFELIRVEATAGPYAFGCIVETQLRTELKADIATALELRAENARLMEIIDRQSDVLAQHERGWAR